LGFKLFDAERKNVPWAVEGVDSPSKERLFSPQY
jgi:hypothetical protein